ncbi:hypothetical protein [Paenibacillus thiaminolyticus]|uniref:hypothetical protein n=1 Tax=Paenibacillus thiaminolyticus TaxID=49283 RepID=UPI002175A45F|nr:hypothetical protein [Paenibacillus thiaminolyticus]
MIGTYSTYDDGDPERCEIDEVVLNKEFPSYPEELSYMKYSEFLHLIQDGLKEVIFRFEKEEKEEISRELNKARIMLQENY